MSGQIYSSSFDGVTVAAVQDLVEYKNPTHFLKIIQQLHKGRLIFKDKDGQCQISPTGIVEAERTLIQECHAD